MNNNERIQKIIANYYNYCSRRKAEQLIIEKKVKLNGQIVNKLGVKANYKDIIEINNQVLTKANEQKIYLMLNKPRNCVSTVSDTKNRITVMNYLKDITSRIYPIGRLDYDTSGLLLFTNDGDFSNIIAHPKHIISKTYHALVQGLVKKNQLLALQTGVKISDDFTTSKASTKLIDYNRDTDQSIVELIINEGKKHQVKKMFQVINHPVVKLKRVAIGFLQLEQLKPGEYQFLKPKEIKKFFGLFNGVKK